MGQQQYTYIEMGDKELIKFLQSRLHDVIDKNRLLSKRCESLRRQKLPKIVYVESDGKQLEEVNLMLDMCIKENEAINELNDSLKQKLKDAETIAQYSDEIAKMYQAEIQSLQDELAAAKEQAFNLQQQLNIRTEEIKSMKDRGMVPLLIEGVEEDLYFDEQRDMVLEVLEQAYQTTSIGTRKHDVLKSILDANPQNGDRKSLKESIINWFKEFTGWKRAKSTSKKEFMDMGFNLVSLTNHAKFNFSNDDRYMIIIPTTPSDMSRGIKNDTANIIKTLF